MSDNMTSPNRGENALSVTEGAATLASLREKLEPSENEETAEEIEAEAEPEEGEVEAQADGDESIAADDSESSDEGEESQDRITLPDGAEITVEEASKGYLRESDYTRKMQHGKAELKADREAAEAQLTEQFKSVKALYDELAPLRQREPDWSALVDEVGADQAMKHQMAWNKSQSALNQVKVQTERHQKEQLSRAQVSAREVLQTGQIIPEWANGETLSKALPVVSKYLVGLGYPAEVLGQLADPMAIALAEKARRWDELQGVKQEAKRVVKSKPQVIKPGSRNQASNATNRGKSAALNRFQQTKTVEDGLSALAALRKVAGG